MAESCENADFEKKLRKMNYLTLAKEFAALKKINEDALPFDLHKLQETDCMDSNSSSLADSDHFLMELAEDNASQATSTCSSSSTNDVLDCGGEFVYSAGSRNELSTVVEQGESEHPESASTSEDPNFYLDEAGQADDDDTSTLRSQNAADISKSIDSSTTDSDTQCALPSTNTASDIERSHDTLDSGYSGSRIAVNSDSSPNGFDITAESTECGDEASNEFYDIYSIDSTLQTIKQRLEQAENSSESSHRTTRQDRNLVLQKLQLPDDDEDYLYPPYKRVTAAGKVSNASLQICFLNECHSDEDEMKPVESAMQNMTVSPSLPPPPPVKQSQEDFYTRQARLHAETQLALAKAPQLAHIQVLREKGDSSGPPATNRNSAYGMNEVITCPLSSPADGAATNLKEGNVFSDLLPPGKYNQGDLGRMSVSQLQVLFERLHFFIQQRNVDLIMLLQQRDELHMAQDAILVDIADLDCQIQNQMRKYHEKKHHNLAQAVQKTRKMPVHL